MCKLAISGGRGMWKGTLLQGTWPWYQCLHFILESSCTFLSLPADASCNEMIVTYKLITYFTYVFSTKQTHKKQQ